MKARKFEKKTKALILKLFFLLFRLKRLGIADNPMEGKLFEFFLYRCRDFIRVEIVFNFIFLIHLKMNYLALSY